MEFTIHWKFKASLAVLELPGKDLVAHFKDVADVGRRLDALSDCC